MTPEQMRRAAEILECNARQTEQESVHAHDKSRQQYGDMMTALLHDAAAECRDLARLLREQADAMGWRPIATAPQDGTELLLMRMEGRVQSIADGRYLPGQKYPWIWMYGRVQPEFWMPLPPPPTRREL